MPGPGRGPFTAALKTHLATPDVTVADLMARVHANVARITEQRQLPWHRSALAADFYFARTMTASGE